MTTQEQDASQEKKQKPVIADSQKRFEVSDLRELFESSPAIKKALGSVDVRDGVRYKEVLFKIKEALVREINKLEGGEKEELQAFQQKIEQFLELEQGEVRVDHEVVIRTSRDIAFAEQIDNLEQGEEFDAGMVAGVLERRKWGKIFTNLEPGDKVLSFLVPGADFLSIKYLNDAIFGPQVTNEIIAQKRTVLETAMKKINPDISFLQSDYKTEVIKVPGSLQLEEGVLEKVSEEVDVEMTKFVLATVSRILEHEQDPNRIAVLKKFEKDLLGVSGEKKNGFKMNYGVATVGEGSLEDLAQNQLLALNQSLQTSRMSREVKDGSYGAEYSEAKTVAEVNHIQELRQEIIGSGNTIADVDGNEFVIFEEQQGRYAFNRDLLRDVRKGKFKAENKKLLEKVALYVKKLNILDAVKPFVKEDLSATKDEAVANHELSQIIKNKENVSADKRKMVAELLRANEKDAEYTSNSEFHKRAVAMKDAAYISLDVLDLGVDLLLEYESALQEVEQVDEDKKAEKIKEISLSAGDRTTDKLRDFRKSVAQVYREFGLGDGLVVGEIGGDELTLAVDISNNSALQTKDKMDDFLFALKKATNTRVVKTVVSQAEKHINDQVSEQGVIEAHLEAIKRAEQGSAIAKDIEEAARKLGRILKKQGKLAVESKLDGLSTLFAIKEREGVVEANFVVIEGENDFRIASSNNPQLDYKQVKADLDKILGRAVF
ncbi:MAG: hypothetical protein KBC69_01410 [Candidatus Magasanikbacteria bacterium]|nr:hypothetical protein [Candidatus Magasanikbacteria bacterium]